MIESQDKKDLEEFFRNNYLGHGRGGELLEYLADTIDGLRTGRYVFRKPSETRHPLQLDTKRLENMGLTKEEAIEYIRDPEFPGYVVKACQEMYPSDCHHPAFIYRALRNIKLEQEEI